MTRPRPNLVFIMSDDHAAHSISTYGSVINRTPNIDRIADGGMRFDSCFCTNSICAPSRASILTGTYNHVNGVTTLDTKLDNSLDMFPQRLRDAGYQTALFGKWHLGHGPTHSPAGFDTWRVLPGQGFYHDPKMLDPELDENGRHVVVQRTGYVTDLITDDCIDWLDQRDRERPFALLCHHKAPHRSWESDERHATMYEEVDIPEPSTLWDDHGTRADVVKAMHMHLLDLHPRIDLKAQLPPGLSEREEVSWRYQRYIKEYLRVVASIDDNVGRVLDWLDENGLADDTIVVYTSDQGFFLGDHGWFDKRMMYEESVAMPLLVRYPALMAAHGVEPGVACEEIVLNVDFAATVLDLAGVDVPDSWQGPSFAPLLRGESPPGWRTSMYYRYWMHRDDSHQVPAHYGVRTRTHKLIGYYNDPLDQPGANGPVDPPEWELYDLVADPHETRNVISDRSYAEIARELHRELLRLQAELGDAPYSAADDVLYALLATR
jgi:arylsulfatase A-like enzyme